AGHEQLKRPTHSHEARKPLRPAVTRTYAEFDLGLTELRDITRDADVAGHRKLASAAEREPVHGRDHRLWRWLQAPEDVLATQSTLLGLHGRLRGELADVGSSDERAAGSRENDSADVVAVANLVDRVTELADGRCVQRVQLVGTIDRDRGDT